MTEQEYSSFVAFIDKLLYEIMTLEDYEIILNRLDIPIRVKTNDRWGCATGCHNVNAYDGGSNLSFYTEDRIFHCFSQCQCNYNLITLVEQRFKLLGEPKKRIQCTKWICEQLGIPFEFNVEIKHDHTTIYNWKANLDKYLPKTQNKKELKIYDETILEDPMFDKLYPQEWENEGISEVTMDRYEITYYKRLSQVIIPVRDMLGALVAIRCRNFNPKFDAKYDVFRDLKGNEYKCYTDLVMYGIYQNAFNIQRKKKVIVCESEKSVLMMDSMYGKDENICLALMGSKLSDENVKSIIQLAPSEIVIGMDSDFHVVDSEENECFEVDSEEYEKFEKKILKMYDKLKPYCSNITCIYNNLGFKDMYKASPFDLGKERFELLWDNREKIEDDI